MQAGEVNRVCAGHLPHGDAPMLLRIGDGVDVITADFTYSAFQKWDEADRGELPMQKAVHEVVLGPGDVRGRAHGVLSNGLPFSAAFEDPCVGRGTVDGWMIKGR